MDMIHKVSELALRRLSPAQFARLRRRYLELRRRLGTVTRLVYGSFETADLRHHLEQRIGRDFEVLMVHSSINGLKPMYRGNPLDLVRMLMAFCGPERTLAMPAFYFGEPDLGSPVETFRRNPVFDLRRTPSQMGLATELFRRSKGVLQSRHPVDRIAALGPLAQELIQGHEHARSPTGLGSPFERMAARDTLILGLGKTFHVITQVHFVEDQLGTEFPVPRTPRDTGPPMVVTVVDGNNRIPVTLGGAGLEWRLNMDKLPRLLHPGDLKRWRFHGAPLFAVRAARLGDALTAAAKKGRTLYDPP